MSTSMHIIQHPIKNEPIYITQHLHVTVDYSKEESI